MALFSPNSPNRKLLIGMIHVGALPGTPRGVVPIADLVAQASEEAGLLRDAGFDAILIENMHDRPYLKGTVGPEIVAGMTRVATAVRETSGLPTGIQILAAANTEALAVAVAAGLAFIRCEGFVFAHVADEGWIDGCAGELLRYRKKIGGEDIAVLTDIKKKHSAHAVTADVSLGETAAAAQYFLSDGLIVTGPHTGLVPDLGDLAESRSSSTLPLFAGSGVTAKNCREILEICDGVIVGSDLKVDGRWDNPPDPARLAAFTASARE